MQSTLRASPYPLKQATHGPIMTPILFLDASVIVCRHQHRHLPLPYTSRVNFTVIKYFLKYILFKNILKYYLFYFFKIIFNINTLK